MIKSFLPYVVLAALMPIFMPVSAHAHFQVLIPTPDTVDASTGRDIQLRMLFTHPMENGPAMEMGIPIQMGVMVNGKKTDLTPSLQEITVDSKRGFTASHKVKTPGAHLFYLEPAPYWEKGEKNMIIHYTKVIVDAFDSWSGWDANVGFPVEIDPLTRPYGLWVGNVFQGIVKKNGAPVPFVHVEIEYNNTDNAVEIPGSTFITQVVKTDSNGVFTYAMPKAGWWGFAALIENDQKMQSPDGQEANVELGALLWVRAVDMRDKSAAPDTGK